MSTLYKRAADLLRALQVSSPIVMELEAAHATPPIQGADVYYDAGSANAQLERLYGRLRTGELTDKMEILQHMAELNYVMDTISYLDQKVLLLNDTVNSLRKNLQISPVPEESRSPRLV